MLEGIGFLCLVFCVSRIVSFSQNESNVDWGDSVNNNHIVAFYNLFGAKGTDWRGIAQDQINMMNASGLLDRLEQVFYVTSGNEGKEWKPPTNKFKHLQDFGTDGQEDLTLSLVYRFCQSHPHSKFLYFHDKGSFHPSDMNLRFRKTLDCFVLTPTCIAVLNEFDTCGFRFTPVPWPHYTGNFFWATCNHVNKLVDPLTPHFNATFQKLTAPLEKVQPECNGVGRHFSEAWVGSLPNYKPADCFPSEVDNYYFFGMKSLSPQPLAEYCPVPATKTFGRRSCGIPHYYNYPDLYVKGFHEHANLFDCGNDRVGNIVQRSMAWYGQPPTLFLDYFGKLNATQSKIMFKEGDYAYFVDGYKYVNGCFKKLPMTGREMRMQPHLYNATNTWALNRPEIVATRCSP